MSNDPIAVMRSAERFVTRALLNELMTALCMTASDPMAEARRRMLLNFASLDNITEGKEDQYFMHSALHEMETFWRGVEQQVQGRVAAGLP